MYGASEKCQDELDCTVKFHPPLLSTPAEFCTEAERKGVCVPKCHKNRLMQLEIKREPPPLEKLTTTRHLRNWRRWCYIWRQTYNAITAKRNLQLRPPIMASLEDTERKNEDKELFDRTLHPYYMDGFYVKNILEPDSIRPKPFGADKDIKEVVLRRYYRDYPEMKRRRYPNYVRNEVSLPPRKPVSKPCPPTKPTTSSSLRFSRSKIPTRIIGYDFEEGWKKTKQVNKAKKLLACEMSAYGKTDPFIDDLIMKPEINKEQPVQQLREPVAVIPEWNLEDVVVPEVTYIKEDEVGDAIYSENPPPSTLIDDRKSMKSGKSGKSSLGEHYTEFRGPILRIRSNFNEINLTLPIETGSDMSTDDASLMESVEALGMEDAYFYDDNHHFSITSRCKDTKRIELKNEGTTAIRFQWFRNPPNDEAIKMLEDLSQYKTLRLQGESIELDPGGDEDNLEFDKKDSQETLTEIDPDIEPPAKLTIPNKTSLEFHFSQMPSVLLPGQTIGFPIIFRAQHPGHFHETIFLLTHPRVSCIGKYYAVRLSGVCTHLELPEKGNELYEADCLKRELDEQAWEKEAVDVMDSVVERALWEMVNPKVESSTSTGFTTSELEFNFHNKNLFYHKGHAEAALQIVNQLMETLVPPERMQKELTCALSIQSMYDLLLTAKSDTDLNWNLFFSDETETALAELHQNVQILSEPRFFATTNTDHKKYVEGYANSISTVDDILRVFDDLMD